MPNTREKLIDVFMHLDRHIQNRDEYGICYTSDFVEAVETVLAMLKSQDAHGVTVQKWIPVTERLPQINAEVLVCDTREDYVSVWEYMGEGLWFGNDVIWATEDITHWMPLPEASKETIKNR